VNWSTDNAGAFCVDDGYVHPDYQTSAPEGAQPSGSARDPYSMKSLPSNPSCGQVSRT
jgi:hypothetical protein